MQSLYDFIDCITYPFDLYYHWLESIGVPRGPRGAICSLTSAVLTVMVLYIYENIKRLIFGRKRLIHRLEASRLVGLHIDTNCYCGIVGKGEEQDVLLTLINHIKLEHARRIKGSNTFTAYTYRNKPENLGETLEDYLTVNEYVYEKEN